MISVIRDLLRRLAYIIIVNVIMRRKGIINVLSALQHFIVQVLSSNISSAKCDVTIATLAVVRARCGMTVSCVLCARCGMVVAFVV